MMGAWKAFFHVVGTGSTKGVSLEAEAELEADVCSVPIRESISKDLREAE